MNGPPQRRAARRRHRAGPRAPRHSRRSSTARPTTTGRGRSDPARRRGRRPDGGWPMSASACRVRERRGGRGHWSARVARTGRRAGRRSWVDRARPGFVGPSWCHRDMAATQLITDPATRGLIRLIGGPGTEKTSLLVDAAAAHLAAGAHPESVLLLCPTARAAVRTRRALSTALTSGGGPAVIREPLVRTLHSYAFAILRLAARRPGDPPPRLITGTAQDRGLRGLLG